MMASRVKYPERNAEIIRRRQAGEWPTEIAKAMGLTRNMVIGTLNRAGLCDGDVDRSEYMRLFSPRGEASAHSRLTEAAVADIRANWRPHSRTQGCRSFAEKYGVRMWTVWKAASGKTWKHVQ